MQYADISDSMLLYEPMSAYARAIGISARAAQLAQKRGYSVGRCANRGGAAHISDFAVGLNIGQVRNTSKFESTARD